MSTEGDIDSDSRGLRALSQITIEAFGETGLQSIASETVFAAGIMGDDASFLIQTGLPKHELLQINFVLACKLPSLSEHVITSGATLNYTGNPRKVVCLSEKYGMVVGVNLCLAGTVECVDISGVQPTRFVNSQIRFLVGCLAKWILLWERWKASLLSRQEALKMFRAFIATVDHPALEEDTWWALVLEQMEQGLL